MLGFRNMAPPKKSPEHPVVELGAAPSELRVASERLVFTLLRVAREEAAGEGLSLPQLFILQALVRSGKIPVTQLASWTGASPSAISGLLDGLVEAKLLLREHGVEDRRQVLVSLSAEGRRRIERINVDRTDRWSPLDTRIRGTDARVAARVLQEISTTLATAGPDELADRMEGPAPGRPATVALRESRKVAA
jgi:DNA-binding MarR family transcriptional regulator